MIFAGSWLRGSFAGLALSAAAFSAVACDLAEVGDIDLDFNDPNLVEDSGLRSVQDSDDVIEQAVVDAIEEVDAIRKAEELIEQGLAEGDQAKIEEALRLRPGDPSLYFHLAAFPIAAGDTNAAAQIISNALGVLEAAYPSASKDEIRKREYAVAAPTFLQAMARYPSGSEEWERLRVLYCITSGQEIDPLGILANPTNPPPDCLDK